MSTSSIDRLEQRINQFLERFQALKEKAARLQEENRELKALLEDREKTIARLESRMAVVQAESSQTQEAKAREEALRRKVAELLEKLDALESVLGG